jgi:hypothetical protein
LIQLPATASSRHLGESRFNPKGEHFNESELALFSERML